MKGAGHDRDGKTEVSYKHEGSNQMLPWKAGGGAGSPWALCTPGHAAWTGRPAWIRSQRRRRLLCCSAGEDLFACLLFVCLFHLHLSPGEMTDITI